MEEAKVTVDDMNWSDDVQNPVLDSDIEAKGGAKSSDKHNSVQRSDDASRSGLRSAYWSTNKSMDVDLRGSLHGKNKSAGSSLWESIAVHFSTERVDLYMTLLRMKVILTREFLSMIKRPTMLLASFMLQMFIASLYGVMMDADDAGVNPAAVTSYFGIGAVLIMLTMLQLAFYLYNNNKVFLKEHSRGVYSLVSYWIVGAIPLLVLRTIHFVIYAVISHKLMGLEGGGKTHT